MQSESFEFKGDSIETKGSKLKFGSDSKISFASDANVKKKDTGMTGTGNLEVSIPAAAINSSCTGYQTADKNVLVVVYKEPSKGLSNTNNTITNTSMQLPPKSEKDMKPEELKAKEDLNKQFKDLGFDAQKTEGVRTETANQTSSSITIELSENPTDTTTVKGCAVNDLPPNSSITVYFDAPEKTGKNKTKGAERFFGYLNTTTGNLTTNGIYKDKNGTVRITHLTQFTYYEALVDSQWRFDRLYASPIMWTIAISHMYLLATLVIGLLCYKND